jgi:hypothetical protein
MAQAGNHRYLRGRDKIIVQDQSRENYWKPIAKNKPVVLAHTCGSNYSGGVGKRTVV